jgi:putative tricarboxylic transport membrane protein
MNTISRIPAHLRTAGLLCMAALLAAPGAGAQSPAWKPDRNVELIIGAAQGSAPDRAGREIQRVWQVQDIFDGPLTVVNRPGAGNVVGWTYLNQHAGNGHYLMIGNLNIVIGHAIGRSPFSFRDFAWIAMLFDEYFAVSVRPDSPIRSGAQLIEQLRKAPDSVSIGVSSAIGASNHLAIARAMQRAGVDVKRMKFVAFPGSGQSFTALLGGHIDVVSAAVSGVAARVRNQQVRVLAVSSPRRLGEPLADVPSWKELGVDAVITSFRAAKGPRNMGAGPVAFWQERFARLNDTKDWQRVLETNLWEANFMGGAQTLETVKRYDEEFGELVMALGLRK